MMKTTKKILAVVLTLTIMLSLCVPAFAYLGVQETVMDPYYLLTFGASNTCGYGLHGFLPEKLYEDPSVAYVSGDAELSRDGYYTSGYYFYSDESFPVLIQNALQERFGDKKEVVLDQFALNSMRAYDLRYLLCGDCPADGYIMWRLGTGESAKGAHWLYDMQNKRSEDELTKYLLENEVEKILTVQTDDVRSDLEKAVKRADLIVYDLGVNDFGVYLGNSLGNPKYDKDLGNILGNEYGELIAEAKEVLNNALVKYIDGLDTDTLATIEDIVDTLAYAYVGFIVSFDRCMETFYALNPDVNIEVVGIQNIMSGLTLNLNGTVLPFGQIFGVLLDMANTYTSVLSPYAKRYSYVDVSKNDRVTFFIDELLEYNGDPTKLSSNMIDCFNAYDSGFLTGAKVKDYLKNNGITEADENYETILNNSLNAAYHTLAAFFLTGAKQTELSIDISHLQTSIYHNELREIAYQKVVDKVIAGEESMKDIYAYASDEIAKLLDTEAERSIVMLDVIMGYANCFFSHPSEKGCEEIANAIMRVYDKEIKNSGSFNLINMILGLIRKMNERIDNLVESIVRRVVSIVSDIVILNI